MNTPQIPTYEERLKETPSRTALKDVLHYATVAFDLGMHRTLRDAWYEGRRMQAWGQFGEPQPQIEDLEQWDCREWTVNDPDEDMTLRKWYFANI